MLTQITISNFSLVKSLTLELIEGMTVITGETGAGKSILLDALGLALGERGDASWVRPGCSKAELTATFDLSGLPQAHEWLCKQELNAEEPECILRRVINKEGRSRAFINGTPCPLGHLRDLGKLLIHMHGQHEHHSLLHTDYQRQLLDRYAKLQPLNRQLKNSYQGLKELAQQRQRLLDEQTELKSRAELLHYQVDELQQIAPQPGELEALEQSQQSLAHAEENIRNSQQLLELCEPTEQAGLLNLCHQAEQLLNQLPIEHPDLCDAPELLSNARIQLEEFCASINHFASALEVDPTQLQTVEQRLGALYQLARKHQCPADALPEHLAALESELERIDATDERIAELERKELRLAQAYRTLADKLSERRKKAAKKMSRAVSEHMQSLGMAGGHFNVQLNSYKDNSARPFGQEEVEFHVMTNPGHPEQPLGKVASGGELSRVSLAIQVICAQTTQTPALVFDEVDVGIGGPTAEKIGRLLRQLATKGQVLCVTHQPQVAAQGHSHLHVHKLQGARTTHSQARLLCDQERVAEIARMVAGEELNEHSLAHARTLLEQAQTEQQGAA